MTPPLRPSAVDGALNEAHWCDAVCSALEMPTIARPRVWASGAPAAEGCPDAVTLSPDATAEEVLEALPGRDGASVKDSFSVLDLAPAGFRVLSEARWIARRSAQGRPARDWARVSTPSALAAWASAHGRAGALAPGLLARQDVRVLAVVDDGSVRAGVVLCASPGRAGTLVGVSNVFHADGDVDAVWADVVVLAGRSWPGAHLVGHERADALGPALAVGFRTVGPLRVWRR